MTQVLPPFNGSQYTCKFLSSSHTYNKDAVFPQVFAIAGNTSPSATQWHFPLWKWGIKTSKPPLTLARRGPYLIQQCICPPHAPSQTAAPTVEALSQTYTVKSPLVTMARPKFAPKMPLSVDQSPKTTTCLIPTYDAKRHPDPILRFSQRRGLKSATYAAKSFQLLENFAPDPLTMDPAGGIAPKASSSAPQYLLSHRKPRASG